MILPMNHEDRGQSWRLKPTKLVDLGRINIGENLKKSVFWLVQLMRNIGACH